MKNNYLDIEYIKKVNNYQLMIIATERFKQLLYFLKQERGYKNFKIKIGNFEYDEWKADIYCILNEKGTYFKHIRDIDKKEWSNNTLIEQYAFAWGFEEIEFNINFNIINNYYNILSEEDKYIYDDIYDEVHSYLW